MKSCTVNPRHIYGDYTAYKPVFVLFISPGLTCEKANYENVNDSIDKQIEEADNYQ